MAKRKSPKEHMGGIAVHVDKHQEKLSEMHSALHALGDKIRKPFPNHGEKLLPKNLREQEPEGSAEARKHIDNLHAAMKGCKD